MNTTSVLLSISTVAFLAMPRSRYSLATALVCGLIAGYGLSAELGAVRGMVVALLLAMSSASLLVLLHGLRPSWTSKIAVSTLVGGLLALAGTLP